MQTKYPTYLWHNEKPNCETGNEIGYQVLRGIRSQPSKRGNELHDGSLEPGREDIDKRTVAECPGKVLLSVGHAHFRHHAVAHPWERANYIERRKRTTYYAVEGE